MKRKILSLALSLALALSLCSCGEDYDFNPDDYWTEGEEETPASDRPSDATADASQSSGDAAADISALEDGLTPMGPEGTWTVMVYICGSDLESEDGMASSDLEEMTSALAADHYKIVVETGGAYEWANDVSADELGRYEIHEEGIVQVDSVPQANMGASETLSDFLIWGAQNYPAERMGLILWDHGSGSINGVCFDELSDDDSLTLIELQQALSTASSVMTDKYEFIGFDACLMATLETANVLSPFARYMVASQETESGYGWDYFSIGYELAWNQGIGGDQLGREICDSFYKSCEETDEESSCTLSVVDLRKIPAVVKAFDAFSADVYQVTENDEQFGDFAKAITQADNFGGNNRTEGYTNMVDLAGLAVAGSQYSGNAAAVQAALSDAVTYCVNGSDHSGAGGLSVYYPLQVQGSSELSIFKDVCVSTYYMALVDKVAYGFANAGNISDYDNSGILENDTWYEDWFDDWGYLDDFWEDYTEGESSAISFDVEPYLNDEGTYTFVLSDEGYCNTSYVEAVVYKLSEDEEDLICYGYTTDVLVDWETGTVEDNFDGYWFSLSDGQCLNAYYVESTDDYDIFTAPVLLNDEETNLRFVWYYDSGKVEITGAWDGMSDFGAAARDTKLQAGDVIVPLYDGYAIDSDAEYYYYGEEYVYTGEDDMNFTFLPDGEYYYSFCINDIYGDYLFTDSVTFYVDGYDIYFDK